MAGIGFELKKIFKERSVINVLKGALYSTFAIIGPMVLIIVGFVAMNLLMDYSSIPYGEKDLLVSIILYVFVFSLIFTSPLSAVISRYIADKIYEEQPEDILACYYLGLLINIIVGTGICVPFCLISVLKGGADALTIFAGACMFYALFLVFYTLTFVLALKEYKSIVLTFFVGVCMAVGLSYYMHVYLGISYVLSVLTGASVCFLFIAFVLFSLVRRFFKINNNNYRAFYPYLRRHILLLLTNLCYIMGLYIHNFVFWGFSEYSIVVAKTFISAPVYDTATFLAMLTSVSTSIIFTVRVEINFHQRYQVFCEELTGGIGEDIDRAKTNMFKILIKEIFYIVQTQMIISISIFLLIMVFGSMFGFGGILLTIYPVLAVSYLIIFIMYGMIIFLYYFDDGRGAFISSLVFFVVTAAASYFSTTLSPALYGIGPLFGAFAAWTVSYARLRFIENNLDAHIYCRGTLVKKIHRSRKMAKEAEREAARLIMAGKPNGAPEKPAVVAEKPAAVAEKPAVVAEKPAVVAEKPAVVAEKPAVVAEKPAVVADKPVVVAEKPASEVSIVLPEAPEPELILVEESVTAEQIRTEIVTEPVMEHIIEPAVEKEPEAEPEAASVLEVEVEPEVEPEIELEPVMDVEPEPEAVPVLEVEVGPEVEPEAVSVLEVEPELELEPVVISPLEEEIIEKEEVKEKEEIKEEIPKNEQISELSVPKKLVPGITPRSRRVKPAYIAAAVSIGAVVIARGIKIFRKKS